MKIRNKKHGFLMQASILAVAGILVRIIGMLYRSPLTAIIGDEGNGYYSVAYQNYSMILLVSSYSIPTAVSKIVSGKLALKQYRNAHRTFICAFIYVIVVGAAASLITYFASPFLLSMNVNSVPALKILAPTIFFSGILGVMRGYFQAHGTMVPTSVSQIIEQIFNAVVSVFAAWFFTKGFIGPEDETAIGIYGAAGGALGTGIGVVAGLCFLLFVYLINSKSIKRRLERDQHDVFDSYLSIGKNIILMVTPVIFSTFIYNISAVMDMSIFSYIMGMKGMVQKEVSSLYGVFSTKYMVLINVPVALASAMSTAMIPGVSTSFVTGELKDTNKRIAEAIRFTMLVSIPCAVGLGTLSRPIMQLLFPQPKTIALASTLLTTGCISVIFYALSTVTNGVLQGIGKVGIPVRNAAIALGIHTVFLVPVLYFTNFGVYALLLATVLYSFLMCVLNGFSVKKYLGYKQEIQNSFIIPLISSGVMGAVGWGGYQLTHRLVKSNFISLIVSILLSIFVYFTLMIKLKGIGKEEIAKLPKGKILIKIFRKLRLMR